VIAHHCTPPAHHRR